MRSSLKNWRQISTIAGMALAFGVLVPHSDSLAQFADRKKLTVDVKEVKREKKGTTQNQLNKSAIFTVEVEKKLIEGIDKTLAFYNNQYKKLSKGSEARFNIMKRVWQLNLEQASYVRSEEERLYDDKWTAWDANGRKGPQPKLDTKRSFKYWKEVIAQTDRIMGEYPKNPDADKIIFSKGFALSFIDQEKEAARIYTQLIQKYPNSNVSGDAFSSLGDFYFDRSDFRNAQNNYSKALKYKRSDRYLWSLFKLGWCSYNLNKNKEALEFWKQVVRQAQGKQGAKLRDEALRDMVYAFAELKDVQGAIAYYRANRGEQYLGSLLQLLAQQLADAGNFDEAIKTYRLFQKMLPTEPNAPEMQKDLILLVYELGKLSELWKELDVLEERYGKDGAWASANSKDPKMVLEAKKLVKDQRIYYAKVLHKRGQEKNSVPLHENAKIGYVAFLKSYPDSKENVEVKYNLADVDFFLKNYRDAGKEYIEIVLLGPDKAVIYDANTQKPSNIHRQSAVYMVDAFARDFDTEFKALQKQKPDFEKPPKPLSIRAKNYIKACTSYIKFYPKDTKLVKTCETDIARIYYHSNDKKESRLWLWAIANKYPNDKQGPEAVEMIIPLYADDKPKLLKVTDDFLKVPAYSKGELGDKLRAIKEGATIEAIEKEGNPLEKAKKYQELAEKYPKKPDADKKWYNAAVSYENAGALPAAIVAYKAIIEKYPKSTQVQEATLSIAKLTERRLELGAAAVYYESYANKYPKDAKAKGAQALACDLLIAIDSDKAISSCLNFANKYPNESVDIVQRLILGTQRAKRVDQMTKLITQNYLPRYKLTAEQKIVANYRIYAAYQGKGPQAQQAAQRIFGDFKAAGGNVKGEALRYVGELQFKIANAGMPGFAKIALVGGTVDRLAQSIDRKAQELKKLKAAFDTVIAVKDSYWGVAAFHQLGIAHEQFASQMNNPPEIQGARKEDVKKQLDPQVVGYTKQANEYYKSALDLVTKFNVYNDYSIRVINATQRVNNSKVRFEDIVVRPDFVGSEVSQTVASGVKVGGG